VFSGAKVNAVLDSLPVALITTDANRLIVGANQCALDLFGYEMLELQGHEVEVLIPERFAHNHHVHYRSFVEDSATRTMGAGRDLLALKKDGTEFPVEIGLTVLIHEPPLYLASILDISLRRQAEILMRERQEFLEQSLDEAKRILEDEVAERTRLEERQRLGRELHDSLSQNLYGIGLGLRASLAKLGKGADPSAALEYCLNLTEASLVEMRALLFKLRPKSLEDVPLADVLMSHAQAVTARTKVPIEFSERGTPKQELSFEQKYALFRIATEALHNCMKHAAATQVELNLSFSRSAVVVEIKDDGRGIGKETKSSGHGMTTMEERAQAVGGMLLVDSGAWGTSVQVSIPWTY
jgi:PAS domain S-box-containing protein